MYIQKTIPDATKTNVVQSYDKPGIHIYMNM